jgi:polyisoprenoid-binding protein YceI
VPTDHLTPVGIAAVLFVLIAFAGWYFLLRDDAPPPVNLDDAIASISTTTATATPDATTVVPTASATASPTTEAASATVAPSATIATAPGVDGDLSGTWTVASVGDSFAGYRVGEELSSVGTQTTVGRTRDVTGTLQFDGSTNSAVEIDVNVASLTSDDSRRDRQLRDRGLRTNRFATATCSLTTPIEVNPIPVEGTPFTAVISGELTLHGVTQPVSIELTGQLVDRLVVVVGSTELQFEDFEIVPPTGFIVLSVDDHGTLEFQLLFAPAV